MLAHRTVGARRRRAIARVVTERLDAAGQLTAQFNSGERRFDQSHAGVVGQQKNCPDLLNGLICIGWWVTAESFHHGHAAGPQSAQQHMLARG